MTSKKGCLTSGTYLPKVHYDYQFGKPKNEPTVLEDFGEQAGENYDIWVAYAAADQADCDSIIQAVIDNSKGALTAHAHEATIPGLISLVLSRAKELVGEKNKSDFAAYTRELCARLTRTQLFFAMDAASIYIALTT